MRETGSFGNEKMGFKQIRQNAGETDNNKPKRRDADFVFGFSDFIVNR